MDIAVKIAYIFFFNMVSKFICFSEAMRYGIDSPSGLRPRLNGNAAKARRRCRNALI